MNGLQLQCRLPCFPLVTDHCTIAVSQFRCPAVENNGISRCVGVFFACALSVIFVYQSTLHKDSTKCQSGGEICQSFTWNNTISLKIQLLYIPKLKAVQFYLHLFAKFYQHPKCKEQDRKLTPLLFKWKLNRLQTRRFYREQVLCLSLMSVFCSLTVVVQSQV